MTRAFPWEQVTIAPDRFLLRIGDAEFAHDHARGALSDTPFGDLAWDLGWTPATQVVDCLPRFLVNSRLGSLRPQPNRSGDSVADDLGEVFCEL